MKGKMKLKCKRNKEVELKKNYKMRKGEINPRKMKNIRVWVKNMDETEGRDTGSCVEE